jgi:predicted acyltransferase
MAEKTTAPAPDDFDSAPTRLYSLDALRGFDMFWIMGADEIMHSLRDTIKSPFWIMLGNQFEHPDWNGFHVYDLIFPLFLFMAGVSTPFSVGRELEKGKSHGQLLWRVIKRGFTLVLLGLIVNNGLQPQVVFPIFFVLLTFFIIDRQSKFAVKSTLSAVIAGIIVVAVVMAAYLVCYNIAANSLFLQITNIRFPSVLGRIGIAYMIANIIYLYSKEVAQMVWFWFFIIGYYLLLKFTSAPGFHPGDLTPQGNLASYIDRTILPGHLYVPYPGTKINMHDPEGLFSTIPAISTGILGILTGTLLKNQNTKNGVCRSDFPCACATLEPGLPHQQKPLVKFLCTMGRRIEPAADVLVLLRYRCAWLQKVGLLFQGHRDELHTHLYLQSFY